MQRVLKSFQRLTASLTTLYPAQATKKKQTNKAGKKERRKIGKKTKRKRKDGKMEIKQVQVMADMKAMLIKKCLTSILNE